MMIPAKNRGEFYYFKWLLPGFPDDFRIACLQECHKR